MTLSILLVLVLILGAFIAYFFFDVGKDEGGQGHSVRYFGSWSDALVEQDFTKEELLDLALRKQILFESDNKMELRQREGEFIRALRSNDPLIGYNQTYRRQR